MLSLFKGLRFRSEGSRRVNENMVRVLLFGTISCRQGLAAEAIPLPSF